MSSSSQDWNKLNSLFDSLSVQDMIERIPHFVKTATNLADLAKSTKTLAELHMNPGKDPQLKKSTGYALFSAHCQIELGRFAPAAALLEWLKKYSASKVAIDHLTMKLSKSFSKDAEPSTNEKPELKEISVMPSNTASTLKTPLFSTLQPEEVRALLELASVRKVHLGETLFHKGDTASAFYIVADGELELTTDGGYTRKFLEGDFFGEIAVLGNHKRTATVAATLESHVLEFSKEKLVQGFVLCPHLEGRLFQFYMLRLFLHFAPQHPYFGTFDEEALSQFFYFLQPCRAKAGNVLIEQGAKSSSLYFILEGLVSIEKDSLPVDDLGPGEFVGEMALLTGGARTARVTTKTTCDYLECPDYMFEPLIKQFPTLKDWLQKTSTTRLSEMKIHD